MELALSLAVDEAKKATTIDELMNAEDNCAVALDAFIDAIQIAKGFDPDIDDTDISY
jgi:hypothetical protein